MQSHNASGVAGEGACLEQVLKQASSRAEDIRIEIAALRDRMGGGNYSSTVTVPQLLKGDAVPDVTEPEGKADDPEGVLQYSAVVPSGERQVPPKTEDGTDTEDQQGSSVPRCMHPGPHTASTRAAVASKLKAPDSTPADATRHGGRSIHADDNPAAGLEADAGGNNSWQEVYTDVLQKLNQSRSFRQQLAAGDGRQAAVVLRYMDVLDNLNNLKPKLMQTPFADDMGQAAAIAAGAMTYEWCAGPPNSAQGTANVILPSPVHVVSAACKIGTAIGSATTAGQSSTDPWQEGCKLTEEDSSSAGVSLTTFKHNGTRESNHGAGSDCLGSNRLPLVLPASAADLPVQAVLEELDQLLAWQATRSPGNQHHLRPGITATAHAQPRSSAGSLPATDTAADQHQLVHMQGTEQDPVAKWLQSIQHQRISMPRSNSSGCGISEAGYSGSAGSSECSEQRTMRRSNSMPSAQVANPSDRFSTGNLEHVDKQGSASLRDDIIAQLKLAAAFRPWSQSKSQGLNSEGPHADPVAVDDAQVQDGASLTSQVDIGQLFNGLAEAASHYQSSARGSMQAAPAQDSMPATAAVYSPPAGVRSISTRRSSATAAAIISPAAANTFSATSPKRSSAATYSPRTPSRYQKLLQEQSRSSTSGSPTSAPARRLSTTSPSSHKPLGDSESGVEALAAQGHLPSAAGPVHHCYNTFGATCSACGSPVMTKATPFSDGADACRLPDVACDGEVLPQAELDGVSPAGDIAVSSQPRALATTAQSDGASSPPAVAHASVSLTHLLDENRGNDLKAETNSQTRSSCVPGATGHTHSGRAAGSKKLGSIMGSAGGTSARPKQHAVAAAATTTSTCRLQAGIPQNTSPRKAGYAASASRAVSRVKAATAGRVGSAAGRGSNAAAAGLPVDGTGSSRAGCGQAAADCSQDEAAMVTSISCGQLLHEAAYQQAVRRVSESIESADSICHRRYSHVEATVEESRVSLGALVDGDDDSMAAQSRRQSSAANKQEQGSRSMTRNNSTAGGGKSSGVFVYRLQPVSNRTGQSTATAAAQLQPSSAAADSRGLSRSPDFRSSRQRVGTPSRSSSTTTSAGPPSRASLSPGVSRSSSACTRASLSSSTSGGSQRVWRPGGTRTSARDDCKKLQAYQSARKAITGVSDNSKKRATAADGCRKADAPSAVARRPASPPLLTKSGSKGAASQKAAKNTLVDVGTATDATGTEATHAQLTPCQQATPPAVTEQGVQANMLVASGLERASSLLNELKHKSEPNNRHSSPGRMQRLRLSAAPGPAAMSPAIQAVLRGVEAPPGPASPTTGQVEEAIKAAQVALLQRRWQLAQLRRAMQQHNNSSADSACSHIIISSSLPSVASGCRITAGSRTAVNVSKHHKQLEECRRQGAGSLTSPTEQVTNSGDPVTSLNLLKTLCSRSQDGLVNSEDSHDEPQPATNSAVQQSMTAAVACSAQDAAEAVQPADSQHTTLSCFAVPHVQGLGAPAMEQSPMSNGPLHVARLPANHSRSLDSSPLRRRSSAAGSLAAEMSAAGNLTARSAASASVPLPAWSVPRRVSSSGMTGEELMQYYRKSSAAETAEAAAIAEAEGAAEGTCVAGAMNLDAMLKAYNALCSRRNTADKSAILNALMSNMIAMAGVQAARQDSSHGSLSMAARSRSSELCMKNSEQVSSTEALKPGLTVVAEKSADMDKEDASGLDCGEGGCNSRVSAACAPDKLTAATVAAAAEGSAVVIVRKATPGKAVSFKDTATGKAVLVGIGGANPTVQQAVQWLRVGLTRMPTATSASNVQSEQHRHHNAVGTQEHCATYAARSATPSKMRPQSRPCSPFHCFGARELLSDEEDDPAGQHQQHPLPDESEAQQQPFGKHQDGVHFTMDEGQHQLVMVVPKHMALSGAAETADACRYTVIGVSLLCGGGANGGSRRSLDLLTCAGRHRIELASERDWAGLLAGLNAMLLLREAQSSGTSDETDLEGVLISEIAWSSAVEGVEL